jgi:hypothetical protein
MLASAELGGVHARSHQKVKLHSLWGVLQIHDMPLA